jgi:hypothetical protein
MHTFLAIAILSSPVLASCGLAWLAHRDHCFRLSFSQFPTASAMADVPAEDRDTDRAARDLYVITCALLERSDVAERRIVPAPRFTAPWAP